jgi:hypothetical protein
MVYSFENRKPFFDFEHLIFKLMYPAKTRSEPAQDLTGTHIGTLLESARDFIGTRLRLYRDPLETWSGPVRDLPRTRLGLDWEPP